MPIVRRSETDILRVKHLVDGFVNPTNTVGAMSIGLSMAYREYYGESMYKDFYKACRAGEVKIGRVHVWKDEQERTELLHLPTKGHYGDPFELEILKRALRSLREFLLERPFYSIAMPLLGYGLGDLDAQTVEALNYDYLDDLPNIIHACQLPKAFPEGPPLYLAVIGSRVFSDRDYIAEHVAKALSYWKLTPESFSGMVSGGADGVDAVACGHGIGAPDYDTSLAKELKLPPLIAQADWKRYGRTAGFKRNYVVADIGTHFVGIIDERKKISTGTRQCLKIVKYWNAEHKDQQKLIKLYGFPHVAEKADE